MLNQIVIWMLPAVPRPIVHQVAGRYIAGDTREKAIELIRALSQRGYHVTVDQLGEDTVHLDQARAATAEYVQLMEALATAGVERNISLKLTQFGLRLDQTIAFDQVKRLLDIAAQHDFFVRIDMEDSTVTDLTLDFYHRAKQIYPRVGTVLQSRLLRTVEDARQLAAEGANIRLCKGIYKEPASVAHTRMRDINDAFVAAARVLMDGPSHVALATHDVPLVNRLKEEIGVRPAEVRAKLEFQALLGVPVRRTLEQLMGEGYLVRLYVPYGREWYAYSVRRLKENPDMAMAIAKSLFSRNRVDASNA
jgi:proline dehydrogenase